MSTPVIIFCLLGGGRAGINKPLSEWLCDYCSMSEYSTHSLSGVTCHVSRVICHVTL